MNLPQHVKQEILGPLFQPGAFVVGRIVQLSDKPLLLPYHGPLASDRQEPHDIQVRVARNTGSRKAREPVSVEGPRWVANHPQVYAEFKRVALKLIGQGRKHYGAKGIAEYLRLHTDVEGGVEFKIANFAVTYLAIKFVEEHPQHKGFFNIQKRFPETGEQEDTQAIKQ